MTYQYRDLPLPKSIRLVVLSPGVADDPLQGYLETTSLVTPGEYEAISYIWGSEAKPHQLQTEQGSIGLTQSLYSALKSLRSSWQQRRLWADAICINQDNNDEKSTQVQSMGEIYTSATCVHVYLGDVADRSDVAFDLLEQMASPMWKDKSEDGEKFRAAFAGVDLGPVAAIMNRPWWQRMWIIQEFVNAKDVFMMVGSRQLHWKVVFQAIDNVFSHGELSLSKYYGEYPNTSRGMIAFATLDIGRDKSTASLLGLLDLFQDARATRKRDHLFALLPLAADATGPEFKPDYNEDFDAIVRRYAAAFVDRGHVFRLLGTACPDLAMRPRRFPSWIPDWTTKRFYRDPDGVSTFDTMYKAAGMTEAVAHYDRSTDSLIVRGNLVDSIKIVVYGPSLKAKSNDIPNSGGGNMVEYLRNCLRALQTIHGGDLDGTILDDLRRTLTLDRDRYGDELDEHGAAEMNSAFNEMIRSITEQSTSSPTPSSDAALPGKLTESETENVFCFTAGALSDYLSFAVTEQGLMGLVPAASQTGDWLAILHGCRVAFVLRSTTLRERNNEFYLVRKAYLHGYMDGEATTSTRFPAVEMVIK